MATTPVTPTTTVASSISGYIKAHETLIIVLVLAVLSFIGYNHWLSYQAQHDKQVSATATAVAQAQASANAILSQQAALQQAQYATLVNQTLNQVKSLKSAQAARNTVLTKQQAADLVLPLPALGTRWLTLLDMPNGVSFNNDFIVTPDIAQKTVVQLEQIPVLTADLDTEKMINKLDEGLITQSSTTITSLDNQVAGLKLQITEDQTATADQIKAIKAADRKSKLKWFFIGYGAGLVTRGAIRIFAGI